MSLVRRCPLCGLETDDIRCPTDGMATLLRRPPAVDLDTFAPGLLLGGKYQLVSQIGRGGFGAVFRCTHIGTGQDVAVKVLTLPPGENDAVFRRFFLEARATAGLGHPNTLRVFDFGQDTSGACYLVMELLDGRSLADEIRDRLRRGEVFTEMEALGIGDAVLRSLTEAHDKGLIHRDIKPQNVFLHQVHGDAPVVKVLDFGIAHSAELAAQNALTAAGQILGTPAYMSPEQAQGLPLDGRSDLYSVGIMLYELVAGATPFVGNTPVSTLYMHVNQEVPPLFERARTNLSPGFMQAVEKSLSKHPFERWNDAPTMRQALFGKRGRVTGSQLSVRVSSPHIPVADVTAPTITNGLPQFTVNGETVDAQSLQPKAAERGRRVQAAEPEASPWSQWRKPLLYVAPVALAAALAWMASHPSDGSEDPGTHPTPELRTPRATDAPPTAQPAALPPVMPLPPAPLPQAPTPTAEPMAEPEPLIPPPPPVGVRTDRSGTAGKKQGRKHACDPFDPYCK